MPRNIPPYLSHGDGAFDLSDFAAIGKGVVFEAGVLVFHPENIRLGKNIYVGHQTILKAYHKNYLELGDNSWIGQQCFIHSAGGVTIGRNVGIGPGVRILSSYHQDEGIGVPIIEGNLMFSPVVIGDDSDIGAGTIVLPGVTIGPGVQVGAGAVVTRDLPMNVVAAGVPARIIRERH